jgi:hypothetical protein
MLLDIKITIKRANVPIKLLSTLINGSVLITKYLNEINED